MTMMMMIGERQHPNPTVHVPPWSLLDDPTDPAAAFSLPAGDAVFAAALQRYLPSNLAGDDDDEFRIYEFKVRRCARGRSHDWTECPFAHPGEKARRRDPRKYHYSGTACPEFRKGSCKRGDACEFAHGVFECWLHPARYRTQPCKDGTACRRRVCFFAHTPDQLRVLPQSQVRSPRSPLSVESYDGSPLRRHAALDAYFSKDLCGSSSPISPPSESPPISPAVRGSVNEVLTSLRQLQISKAISGASSWGFGGGSGFWSSLSTTTSSLPAIEEPVERVESGRALRAKMFERLCKEGGLERPEDGSTMMPGMSTPESGGCWS